MSPFKSLHVAIDKAGAIEIWPNDGDHRCATVTDLPTAHLMAAAPELLAVLRDVAALLPSAARLHADDLFNLQTRVCAAIAKAAL